MSSTRIALVFFLFTNLVIVNTQEIQCMKQKKQKKRKKIKFKNPFKIIIQFWKKQKEKEKNLFLRHYSKTNNLKEVKKLVLTGAKQLIDKNNSGLTPLYWACRNNNVKIAKLLIQMGGRKTINIPTKKYRTTPLLLACSYNNLILANLLLNNGANKSTNITKRNGRSPILYACYHNNKKLTRKLIKNGAYKSIDIPQKNGLSPILYACYHNSLTLFNLLIPYCKKTINQLTKNQESPLYCACSEENLIMCKELILNGAKIIHKNIYGVSDDITGKYIKQVKFFDKATNNSQKFKIIEKSRKYKKIYKFMLRLAFSRFLQEKIEKKNIIDLTFLFRLLRRSKYKMKIEKQINQYKKYILRADMKEEAIKFIKKRNLVYENFKKLRNPKNPRNPNMEPDVRITCKK